MPGIPIYLFVCLPIYLSIYLSSYRERGMASHCGFGGTLFLDKSLQFDVKKKINDCLMLEV